MFWAPFLSGFAACLAIWASAHFVREWRQRSAFIASLSPTEREKLVGFETVKGDWHAFRELLIISNHSVPDDPGGRLNMVRWRSRMIDARAPNADRLILGFQLGPNHQDPPHENQRIQNHPSQ
jgi:hypothetical protein